MSKQRDVVLYPEQKRPTWYNILSKLTFNQTTAVDEMVNEDGEKIVKNLNQMQAICAGIINLTRFLTLTNRPVLHL
jgi:c-di-AMP phosphodiesterase-like protein